MTTSFIPDDPLTRKLLAKILAAMIRDDFVRMKAARMTDTVEDEEIRQSDGHCSAKTEEIEQAVREIIPALSGIDDALQIVRRELLTK